MDAVRIVGVGIFDLALVLAAVYCGLPSIERPASPHTPAVGAGRAGRGASAARPAGHHPLTADGPDVHASGPS